MRRGRDGRRLLLITVLAVGCSLFVLLGSAGLVGTATAANTTDAGVFDDPLNESLVQYETDGGEDDSGDSDNQSIDEGGGDIALVFNETVVAADDGLPLGADDFQVRGILTEEGEVVAVGANESATTGSYRVANVIGNSSLSTRIVVEVQQYNASNGSWEAYEPAFFDELELNLSAVETASSVQRDPGWVNVTRITREVDKSDSTITTITDALPVAVGSTAGPVGFDAGATGITVNVTDLNGTQVLSETTGPSHVVTLDPSRLQSSHTYTVEFVDLTNLTVTTRYINGTTLSSQSTLNNTLFEVGSTTNISVTLDTNRGMIADETASAYIQRSDGSETVAVVRNVPYDSVGNITHQFPRPSDLDTFPKRGSYEVVAADDSSGIGGSAQQFDIDCGVVSAEATLTDPGCYNLSASQTNVTATDGVYLEISTDTVTLNGRGATIDANDTAPPEVGLRVDSLTLDDLVTNITIRNLTFQQFNTTGIDIFEAQDVTIENATLLDNNRRGLDVDKSTNITVRSTNTSLHAGNFASGVSASRVTNLRAVDVTALANNGSGVEVLTSQNVTVAGGKFHSNVETGFDAFNSTNLTVRATNASAQSGDIARGLDFDTVKNATVRNVTVDTNNGTGIEIGDSAGIVTTSVSASDNLDGAILSFESEDVLVKNSTLLANDDGFFAFNSTNITVRETNASLHTGSFATGVGVSNVTGLTVSNVTAVDNNGTGIRAFRSSDILLTALSAVENREQGVGVFNSTNATVRSTNASYQTGTFARGVDFDTVTGITVANVTAIGNNGTGLDIRDSAQIAVANVTARQNTDGGIETFRVENATVSDSRLVANQNNGFYASNATNITVRTTNLSEQQGAEATGIEYISVTDGHISNVTANNINGTGLALAEGNGIRVQQASLLGTADFGLLSLNTTNVTVTDVAASDGSYGTVFARRTGVSATNLSLSNHSTAGLVADNTTGRIENTSVTRSETGISISSITGNLTVSDAVVADSVDGVSVAASTGGTLSNITVENSSHNGFVLANATNVTLCDSVARDGQYGLNLTDTISTYAAGPTVNNTVTNLTLVNNAIDLVAGGTDGNPSRATNFELTLGTLPVVTDLQFGALTGDASIPTPPQSWTITGVAVDYTTLSGGISSGNLTLDYSGKLGSEVESSLDLWRYSEVWSQLNATLETGNNTISSPLTASARSIALLANETDTPEPPAPNVGVSLTSVDFGDTVVGNTSTASVSIANTGDAPLGVTGVSVDTSGFSVVGAPTVVPAGATKTVNLTFAPTTATEYAATATIATNDTDVDVSLAGRGLAGKLSLSADSVSFGERNVTAGEPTESLTVSNTGSAPLTIDSTTVTGEPFTLRNGSAGSLPVGNESTVTVAFNPVAGGSYNGTLTLQSDDPETSSLRVPLSGRGLAPNISVTPETAAFGNLTAGTDAAATLTVRNTGDSALTLDSVTASGSAFTVSNTSTSTLAPGTETQLAVTYAPTVVGAYASNVTLETNDPTDGVVTVGLTGSALSSNLSISPLSLDFGNVSAGETVNKSVTITNPTASALNLTALRVTGPDADNVSLTPSAPLTLDSQSSRTLTVSLTPDERGVVNATLVPARDGVSVARIGIRASVRGPDITFSPASLSFRNATVNATSERTVTVRNVGEEPLRIAGTRVGGTGFSVESLTMTLQPGATTNVTVSFTPARSGPRAATVRIQSNAPDEPTARVFLSSTRANVDIQVREDNGTREVTSTVENATAGEQTDIPLPGSDKVDEGESAASFEQVSVTPERSESFSVNVTTSQEPLNTTPAFEGAPNGTEPLSYANITHTIPNENISQATVRTRISRERLAELQSSPEDVSLYRYTNGSWEARPTRVVERTNRSVVFVTNASGFSEWTSAARRPQFDITETTVNVTTATVGDAITIEVFVTNNGGADGIYEAELLLNEVVVDRRSANIPDGGTVQLNFLRTFDNPGVYELQVNDVPISEINVSAETRSVNVSDAPESNETVQARSATAATGGASGDTGGDRESPSDAGGPPVVFIAGALLLLAVGGGAAYYRMNGDEIMGEDADATPERAEESPATADSEEETTDETN